MRVLILIIIYLSLIIIDYSNLKRSKKKAKTVFVYMTLLLIGFIISTLIAIDKAPPSPAVYIEKIVNVFKMR